MWGGTCGEGGGGGGVRGGGGFIFLPFYFQKIRNRLRARKTGKS